MVVGGCVEVELSLAVIDCEGSVRKEDVVSVELDRIVIVEEVVFS